MAPLDPYKPAPAASFNTSTLSKSFGFIVRNTPSSIGIPSNTYNGELPPEIEPTPRIFTLADEPGCPDPDAMYNPGALPCKICSKEAIGICSICFELTLDVAPVNSAFFFVE